MQSLGKCLWFMFLTLALCSASAFAQTDNGINAIDDSGLASVPLGAGTNTVTFVLNHPYEVHGYLVTCSDATRLEASVADLGMAGDHWQATLKLWDKVPMTKKTTCSGVLDAYSRLAVVTTKGAAPLQVLITTSYVKGANAFPGAGYLKITTNGTCTPSITDLGLQSFSNP